MWPELNSNWQIILFVWFIFEWLVRLTMLYIVPRRLSPITANGWLLLIMLFPTVGMALFFLFSNPKLPMIRRAKQRAVDQMTQKELDEFQKLHKGIITQPMNADYESLARLATVLGGLPPMKGNRVDFMTDYVKSFKAIAKAIDKAERYIHLEYFLFVMDDSTEGIFKAIERATLRGVKVRFLYDKIVCRSYPKHKQMLQRLTAAGVQHHQMIPLSLLPGKYFTRPDLRNHRKIVVIDGNVAFTGSQNMVNRNYHRKKNDLLYEELVVRIEGPAVWQLNNVFRSDWYPETGEALLDLVEDEDIPTEAGSVIAQVLPSGPSHEEENNLRFYTSMVHAAKKRVGIVVPYFIPDESFLDAVTTAAQRGVEVTIINSEIMDKLIVGRAQRSYYEELLQSGVNIYLYNEPVFLHNKQVLIDDDMAVVGSSNLDVRSFALDLELNVIIYDKETVATLQKIETDYLTRAKKVTLSNWVKRPLHHKITESLARITAPLQ
jgi:cardiolipin synthase